MNLGFSSLDDEDDDEIADSAKPTLSTLDELVRRESEEIEEQIRLLTDGTRITEGGIDYIVRHLPIPQPIFYQSVCPIDINLIQGGEYVRLSTGEWIGKRNDNTYFKVIKCQCKRVNKSSIPWPTSLEASSVELSRSALVATQEKWTNALKDLTTEKGGQ